MKLFPLFASLRARPVMVVGGSAVAEREIKALLSAGSLPRVGAPQLTPTLAELARRGRIAYLAGRFQPEWLDGAWLVIAASGDPALDREVATAATVRRLWVNVVDNAQLSTFHALAAENQTLAVYMSVGLLADLQARLLAQGRAAATPLVIVESGTCAGQQLLSGTLADLPRLARQYGLRAPALLIIGEVAAFALPQAWFGGEPYSAAA